MLDLPDLPDLSPRPTRKPLPELPPRPTKGDLAGLPGRTQTPASATQSGRAERRPGKPDPRPMRVVYGAGAVAAVSVMTVGLVQPSWGPQTSDLVAADQGVSYADPGSVGAAGDTARRQGVGARAASAPNVQVRHVIRYVHLKPGQTAPPGATVITPGAPTPRLVAGRAPVPAPAANPQPHATARPPAPQPPTVRPQPQPRPTHKPVTTRQSGRP